MNNQKITIQNNENCKFSKDVYVNNTCIGCVMATYEMTPLECYQSLKNNWEIDKQEKLNN